MHAENAHGRLKGKTSWEILLAWDDVDISRLGSLTPLLADWMVLRVKVLFAIGRYIVSLYYTTASLFH